DDAAGRLARRQGRPHAADVGADKTPPAVRDRRRRPRRRRRHRGPPHQRRLLRRVVHGRVLRRRHPHGPPPREGRQGRRGRRGSEGRGGRRGRRVSLSADEVRRFLAEPPLAGAAADLELSDASLLGDLSRLRESVGDMARPVVELEKARRSVRGKLPEGWLLDSDSAQQATHAAVARRRARRIAASGLAAHDVTCSIGGEVAALADAGVDVLGTDLDFARVLMARHNVGGTGPGPAAPGRASFAVADALAPVSSGRAVIADPARRSGGRRIARPEDLIPPLPDLLDAWAGHELAVKCAPGLDYSDWDGEAAVTSVDGGVKEVCLYTPGLSGRGEAGGVVRRSAHLLRTR